jgi:hypothetical protein
MRFEGLKPLRVSTGVNFGQECYLDVNRSQAFHDAANEIYPNCFTRYNYSNLPDRLVLEHPRKRQFIASLSDLTYVMFGDVDPDIIQKEFLTLFDCFKNLFALDDIRRVGKIFDFKLPHESPDRFLSQLVVVEDEAFVSDIRLLFRRKGKNINVFFKAIKGEVSLDTIYKATVESSVSIRCDINNIDVDSPLDMSTIFDEIFGFADNYVNADFKVLLNKYLGECHE